MGIVRKASGIFFSAFFGLGFAALAVAVTIGRTKESNEMSGRTSSLAYLALGTSLFWVGVLIHNASRTFVADGFISNAFVTTHLAACTGLIGWAGAEWLTRGKTELTSLCVGPVATVCPS